MKSIQFSTQKFDAIIILNSGFNEFKKVNNLKIPIFAADGAAVNLLRNGIIPDYVIGDLDSFNPNLFDFPLERLIANKNQDINDFEKCLNFALDSVLNDILILGVHGGDFEHSLNNWSIISRYSKKMNLVAYENERYAFCCKESFVLPTEVNELISMMPLKKSKINTNGLKWNLQNEIIELGVKESLHNIAIGEQIQVDIEFGELFVFCNSRL
jgi:thiamine pyrophosphokinase